MLAGVGALVGLLLSVVLTLVGSLVGDLLAVVVVLRVFTLSVIILARVRSYGSILDVSGCSVPLPIK